MSAGAGREGVAGSASVGSAAAEGLASLVERHRRRVWRYLRVLGADAGAADELLQDVFVVAWRRGLEERGGAATFAFLRATARHLWLKHGRRRGPVRDVEEADRVWDEAHRDGWGGDDDGWLAALRACVEQLPQKSRALVEARYGRELGRAELAREFGLSAAGAKTALRRVRDALRECVERRRQA
ncbi:MAG: RNA polymerase sigma factor [Planctomycetota bacterium]